MEFHSVKQVLEFYFDEVRTNCSAINVEQMIKSMQKSSSPGPPEWIEEFATIGRYLKKLRKEQLYILGFSYGLNKSDIWIAQELRSWLHQGGWNADRVHKEALKAFYYLSKWFREAGVITREEE